MKILNLGCGTKTSASPDVTNIDWSMYLRLKRSRVLRRLAPLVLRGVRRERFAKLPDNVLAHNLAKGIPFPTDSVDVVYHSHLLEHIDRERAPEFLLEVKRVLKPGGAVRIVVPDLERLCQAYLTHLSACEGCPGEADKHDSYVADMIEQCVRREGFGTAHEGRLRRFVENWLMGDARQRGETHQWMYDRVNLSALLVRLGYKDVQRHRHDTSRVPDWGQYGLDVDEDGHEYQKGSLYIEAIK